MTAVLTEATPKITVILPVYNVASFLPRCLASIEAQTFRDFILLAIDDGATDESGAILDAFAAEHSYCKVVHQHNQGLSASRNNGIAMAESEYIAFLDSDDFVEPEFLEKLYHACADNDADIACCFQYYYFPENGRNVLHPFRCSGVLSREEAVTKLLQDIQIQSYTWNKLYRRKLFTEHNITYPVMIFEDMATTHRLFLHANKVAVIPDLLYHYTQRKNSILKSPNQRSINDFVRAAASMRISLEEIGDFQRFRKAFRALCRKTNFYADYYLLKIHLRDRSLRGLVRDCRTVRHRLRYYQTDLFPAVEYVGRPLSALPATLRERVKK